MKRKVITLLLIFLVIITATLIGIKVSYAWESSSIEKNAINVTIQSNYIENDATMAITLKSANAYGEGNNELTKNELIETVKGKYGVNIIKAIYDPDGVTVAEGTECVGTGYKVQLVTNKMLTVVLYGDVDCNGVVDTDDTVAIAKHNVNTLQLNKYQEKAAHLTVKKNAKDLVIDTDDTVRVAFYNVNGLGKGNAGETIVDTVLYPADEQFESRAEVENINDADNTYKTALSTFTKGTFTENSEELVLQDNKLTGAVKYNFKVGKDIFPEDELTGYYFGYVIKAQGANENTTLKIKNGDKEVKEIPYASFDTTEGISMIASLSKTAENKKIEIEVDLDGAGKLYKPYIVTIDYNELELREPSTFTIEDASDENTKIAQEYGWKKPSEDYTVTFNADTEEENTVNVKGLIPYFDSWNGKSSPFGGEAETGYYLPFVINTEKEKTDKTTVKILDEYNNGKETKSENATYLSTNFDETNKLYVLKHLHLDEKNKSFKIVVDMDGDETNYDPYTITINWSELSLQQESKAEIKLSNASDNDKKAMENWGYKTPNGQEITVKSENSTIYLDGKLIEQELTDVPFGNENKDGYYFDFTINHPDGINVNSKNVKIKRIKNPNDIDKDVIKEFKESELDENNNLTILYRFDTEETICDACKEKEKCDGSCCGSEGKCEKQAYYVVDWDGDGKEFLPVVYTLDFCKLSFERSSIFTVDALPEDEANDFGVSNAEWYDTDNGYSVTVTQDAHDTTKYEVAGVLPIFDDESGDWKQDEKFDTDNKNLYYLGLVLKLVNPPSGYNKDDSKTTIKFYHNEGTEDDQFAKATGEDFDSSHELYILKALTEATVGGGTLTDEQKVFTITVDLDGEDEDEYAPYTVTIDWSDLKLQCESAGNFGNYDVLKQSELTEDSPEQVELNRYGFKFEPDSGVELNIIEDPESQDGRKQGLKGTIKEQNLTNGFETNKGYYVPIKVEFPGNGMPDLDEYKNTWTLILNTEGGETKEYYPTEEEYNQGWVMVLFKVEKEGKQYNGDAIQSKKIKYQIDFDGTPKKGKNTDKETGYVFVPQEYSIDYESLNFETEN